MFVSQLDAHRALRYHKQVICSFKHKGLEKYYATGSAAGIQINHKRRLKILLTALDTASVIEDMKLPGFGLHSLTGKRQDIWSVMVNGNWRLTFKFEQGNVYILDYEDYH